ncbi:MAG: hypothetical protein V3U19_10930 [Thermodesulfobacteriota bacterium]
MSKVVNVIIGLILLVGILSPGCISEKPERLTPLATSAPEVSPTASQTTEPSQAMPSKTEKPLETTIPPATSEPQVVRELTSYDFKPKVLPEGIAFAQEFNMEKGSHPVESEEYEKFLSKEAGVPINLVNVISFEFSQNDEIKSKYPLSRADYPPTPEVSIIEFGSEDQAKSLESTINTSVYSSKIIDGQKVYYYKDAWETESRSFTLPEYLWFYKNFYVRVARFVTSNLSEEIMGQIIQQTTSS